MKIAPSVLAADFGRLSEEVMKAHDAGADLLHVDVMDGHFVPNITFGPQVVSVLKKASPLPLDVHLMISHPDKYLDAFIDAGADYLTVHVEAEHALEKTLEAIKARGVKAGPALNPNTSVESFLPVLPLCDIVLIMSVYPGFGGQKFMGEVLEKVEQLVRWREEKGLHFEIEIDGGITLETLPQSKQAGIDIAVSGTALYGSKDMEEAIRQMKAL